MMFSFGTRMVFTGLLLLLSLAASAQKYRTAAGLRVGRDNFGVTVQQKIFERTTLEGIGLIGTREVSATLLAEQHFGLLGKSLNYYLGGGAHIGTQKDNGGFGGFDAIAGVEYKIAFVPVVLSLDIKPSVEISSDDWFRFPAALSVRYILIKDKKEGFLNGVFGDGDDRDDRRRQREREQKKRDRNKDDSPRRGLFDF
ncbi:hypothetical protein [Hymenobacter radiodurans]|uniref:hypothetical protein n=1 Tax=Hymenobacter radiodurans TaxID=2496028 RepID=UPI00105853C2|nr:hypothetical protein [Hymenobacter radiodurans]